MNKIPTRYNVGGQLIEVTEIERFEDDKLGECCVAEGFVKIAKTFRGRVHTESSKFNTFCHELTHTILDTMGRTDLSEDEVFVNSFAGFLTESLTTMK